jgi:tripartite-type tricarboxylate transporter receptor subunit TctC
VRVVLTDRPARMADLPDVPTAREVGLDLKGFRDRSWFGLFAPKGLPAAIADRISDAVARIASELAMKEKLLLVAQYAHHQPQPEFARQVEDDKAFFTALLKELDIKLE